MTEASQPPGVTAMDSRPHLLCGGVEMVAPMANLVGGGDAVEEAVLVDQPALKIGP
jgi:hypothetical protein